MIYASIWILLYTGKVSSNIVIKSDNVDVVKYQPILSPFVGYCQAPAIQAPAGSYHHNCGEPPSNTLRPTAPCNTRNSSLACLESYSHNCGDLFNIREQLTCALLVHYLFITYSQLAHTLFVTCSWVVYVLLMTCSWLVYA